MFEYLIKNGHVVDPAAGVDEIKDICVSAGRIIPAADAPTSAEVIDASGCYVFPGLIDFHTHIFKGGSDLGADPDFGLANGVTAMVDAGTAGYANFPNFYDSVVNKSTVKIKSYLNVYSSGQIDMIAVEHFSKDKYKFEDIARVCRDYPDNILGLKIRFSKGVADDLEGLTEVIKMADAIGTGVCVHTTDPPASPDKIAESLRKGDIYCHCYQGRGENILDENGHVRKSILEARAKGVYFDAANGFGNFSIDTCKQALAEGFTPDIISTDWLRQNANRGKNVRNLPSIMSKYLELGMSINDIVRCVTATPAKIMKMEGKIGTLKPGAYGDVAVFAIEPGNLIHYDFFNKEYVSHRMFVPKMVLTNGECAYRQMGFAE